MLLVEGSVLCLSSIGEFCLGGQEEVVGKRVNEVLLCHMGLSISSDVWSLVEGTVRGALDLCFSTRLSLLLMSFSSSDRASGERGCSGERREEGTPLDFNSKASSARMALLIM